VHFVAFSVGGLTMNCGEVGGLLAKDRNKAVENFVRVLTFLLGF
jgi:hypothetical protein